MMDLGPDAPASTSDTANSTTPPPDAQAMTREELEHLLEMAEINAERFAHPILAHDAAQRETIRRLEEKVERLQNDPDYRQCCELRSHAQAERRRIEVLNASLQARLTASEQEAGRLRAGLIQAIGVIHGEYCIDEIQHHRSCLEAQRALKGE